MKKSRIGGLKRMLAMVFAIVMLMSIASTAAIAEGTKILPDYQSYEDTLRAGEELNLQLMGEGAVLLKNSGALPLSSQEKKVTVLGLAGAHLVLGGSGSGAGTKTDAMNYFDLYDGLREAGLIPNQAVEQFYEAQPYEEPNPYAPTTGIAEIDPALLEDYVDSYKAYSDAAIVVIARTGGEMSDRPRGNINGNPDEHYLELTDMEKQLIEHAETYFDKVIVLINSSNAMELGVLEDDDKVDAVLWIGGTGINGTVAVGQILNGQINPSGRTVDVYMADMKKDPTWFNSGDLSQFYTEEGMYSNQLAAMYAEGSDTAWDPSEEAGDYSIYTVLEYNEGIYMGYRWYETAEAEGLFDGEEPANAPGNTGVTGTYYNRNTGVVYPFGFGMSYTSFKYSGYSVSIPSDKDGNVVVNVTVKNTGSYAGKEVVQVYAHSPYINGGIEKAEVDLVDYAKTELLQPGESQQITLEFPLRNLAQFDYNDANGNGAATYEIDAAEGYAISLRSDSHIVKDKCSYTFDVAETIIYTEDENSGSEISAIFSQGDIYDSMIGKDYAEIGVTRADGKFALPVNASVEDRSFDAAYLTEMDDNIYYEPYEDQETDAYYRATVPASWTQTVGGTSMDASVLAGKSYTAPKYDADTQTWAESNDADTVAWEEFMNQMSYEELVTLVSFGSSGVHAMDSINLPEVAYNDGPGQLKGGANGMQTGDYGTFYVSHVVIGSTWNTELAEKQGQIIGNESLYLGTTGWWGPGANVHRSPFGGRNFEYYSQDGVQGGKIAAAVITGVQRKGVSVFIKHLGANEQECLRSEPNNATVISEQALRQIYLKCFEYAFKAGCNGAMTCTTRIGVNPSANNYAFLTELIREEWGCYETHFMEDVEGETWHEMNLNLRAGNSMPLTDRTGQVSGTWDDTRKAVTVDAAAGDSTQVVSNTQWYWVRANAQHVIESVVNSNAMKNNVSLGAFEDSTLASGNTYISYMANIAVQTEGINVPKYVVVEGKLPEGLTLAADGSISGTPTESGRFVFTVEMSGDNWLKKTARFSMTIDESLTMDASEFALNQDNEAQVNCILNPADYETYEYILTGGFLPEGMQMNENGLIYGTPTAEGEYEFTIVVSASKKVDLGFMITTQVDKVERTFNIPVVVKEIVEEEAPVEETVASTPDVGMILSVVAIVLSAGSLAAAVVLNKRKK